MDIDSIDTSYWKLEDNEWVSARKERWTLIKKQVSALYKSTNAKAIIERYYFDGTMPNWEKLENWHTEERHLDLFLFLWLHPSWDNAVLEPLRDAYITAEEYPEKVQLEDIQAGCDMMLMLGFYDAANSGTSEYETEKDEWEEIVMHTDGHNEQLYDLCIGLGEKNNFSHVIKRPEWEKLRRETSLNHLTRIGLWLSRSGELNQGQLDMIYQYEQPLEVWYSCVNLQNNFLEENRSEKGDLLWALYRIYLFDLEKEGDTPRTRCVLKLRKILKERTFADKKFSAMIERTKEATEKANIYAIDTSYWKTKDKKWVAQRKEDWLQVERQILAMHKSAKAMAIVKRYYLRGTMPDWDKLNHWGNHERHLDLLLFLWLHPSWDNKVLEPLRDVYIAAAEHLAVVHVDDVQRGIAQNISIGITTACGSGECSLQLKNGKHEDVLMHTNGHNEQLYDLCIGMGGKDDFPHLAGKTVWARARDRSSLYSLHEIGCWLRRPMGSLNQSNLDMLYQYDQPLAVWYYCVNLNENFIAQNDRYKPLIQKAIHRIYNFDTKKEGDSPRTRCVIKFKKMFDEGEFNDKDFSTMLKQVKFGEGKIENLWED